MSSQVLKPFKDQTSFSTGRDSKMTNSCPSAEHLKSHNMYLRALFRTFLSSVRLVLLPGEPISVLNHTLGEEPFLVIQPKPPLTHFHATSSGPVTGHHKDQRLPLHLHSCRSCRDEACQETSPVPCMAFPPDPTAHSPQAACLEVWLFPLTLFPLYPV